MFTQYQEQDQKNGSPPNGDWRELASRKRDELSNEIASTGYPRLKISNDHSDVTIISMQGLLSARQMEISETPPQVLVDKLADGIYSAYETTEAFARRAVIAHDLTNCVNIILFEKALKRATELDKYLATNGKTIGPLHGLPVSLKNHINIKGVEMNMGYVGWIGRISENNAVIVDILESLGAIPFIVTNMPQAISGLDTINNLYGKTVNPFNRNLSPGGSSGGEGALLAMKGSPLGIASDATGSIRVPASYNGLYGFRGTRDRIPLGGCSSNRSGQEIIPGVIGPISPSAEGLTMFFKAVLSMEPWLLDPTVPRMPWDEQLYDLAEKLFDSKSLCFGMVLNDGIALPNPPYIRAMSIVKNRLEKAGHEVISWSFPCVPEQRELMNKIWAADQDAEVMSNCSLSGEPNLYPPQSEEASVSEFYEITFKLRNTIRQVMEAWRSTATITKTGRSFDGIIMPTSPYPSKFSHQPDDEMYTAISGINDFPTSTFPVTRVDKEMDQQVAPHNFMSEIDRCIYERYDTEIFDGLPIGLQLVGRRGEDEFVLRVTELISECLQRI